MQRGSTEVDKYVNRLKQSQKKGEKNYNYKAKKNTKIFFYF